MSKEIAQYIFYCMQKDSVYQWGIDDWCNDRDIDKDDYLQLELMIYVMINSLEEVE